MQEKKNRTKCVFEVKKTREKETDFSVGYTEKIHKSQRGKRSYPLFFSKILTD